MQSRKVEDQPKDDPQRFFLAFWWFASANPPRILKVCISYLYLLKKCFKVNVYKMLHLSDYSAFSYIDNTVFNKNVYSLSLVL